ncbi:universal stress protein [Maritimibacter sp. DP1N21-5]|uniref:universal stress protein n=1 Tax=Maritimibacter sp. DP1N21-5 TaxID=2836867 RepID=UPI001C45112D|nr:universal stress protein [Maritimibacter sp. DP1N21-5]MBV7409478.1 universal stress protein [Maritimibacter sp. DP1N21-5]
MDNILVATDLSPRSDRAVLRALSLARDNKATCHIVHVVDDAIPEVLADPVLSGARERLRLFTAEYGEGGTVEVHVIHGDPRQAIPETAAQVGAKLVVLGMHRPRFLLDALRETTMEALVRTVAAPVLVVKDPADHDYGPVLVPVSFSPACAAAIRAARTIAPKAERLTYHAIHLPFPGLTGEKHGGQMDRYLTREAEVAKEEWIRKEDIGDEEVRMVTGGLRETLFGFVETQKPTLIALGAHTRSVASVFTLGSFAAHLIRNAPTDLLIARPV